MLPNPFKPTAGSRPPELVGREQQISALIEGIDNGPGAPGRLMIFTGARGVGKTVMLSEVAEVAMRERGWWAIHDAATPGLVARLSEHVQEILDANDAPRKRRITGITLPANLGGFQTEVVPQQTVSLRRRLGKLLDRIEPQSSGLLITIDEVHSGVADLRELATLMQFLIREDRQVALVMAGLPSAVSGLLSETVLTFLRRAERFLLADIYLDEVHDAFVKTIRKHGRDIETSAAELATEATFGYPFLIQLVGYHIWRQSDDRMITVADVNAGVLAARRRLGALVHETALADLSDTDRTFLVAVAADDGPARIADIRTRMGDVSAQYVDRYRKRLLSAGMLTQTERGRVDFALPYLREFLREHAAQYGLA